MSTIIRFLDKSGNEDEPSDWETLHSVLGVFLEPECYAFAIALNRALGWPIVGLMKGSVVEHAVLRSPKGLVDYRGEFFAKDDAVLGMPFGLSPPYELKVVYESDLRAIRIVHEHDIAVARNTAEALWTDYPWDNPVYRRMIAFTDELEALSRKYGIWIRSPVPAQRPILSFACDGEAGYDLQIMMDGRQCMIDRRLE